MRDERQRFSNPPKLFIVMPRDIDSVRDIIEYGRRVIHIIEEMTPHSLQSDELRYDAVIRNLEIMGEAARRVSKPIRWRKFCLNCWKFCD